MSGIPVMDAAEGAAWRFQLDGMLKDLNRVDELATAGDDRAVMRLIASLHEARNAAAEIEQRRVDVPVYKGVSLVKG